MADKTSKTIAQAQALHKQHNYLKAAELYAKLAKADPDNGQLALLAGAEYKVAGEYDKALSFYIQAINASPDNVSAYLKLSEYYTEQRDFDKAMEINQHMLKLDNKQPSVYAALGLTLLAMEQPEMALEAFNESLHLDPNKTVFHINLGNALVALKHFDEACDAFRKAVELDPKVGKAYYNLGFTLTKQGKDAESIAALQQCIKLNEFVAEAYASISYNQSRLLQIDEAIASAQKAIAIDPNHTRAHLGLGILYLLKGNFEKGWDEYEWRLNLPLYSDNVPEFLSEKPRWHGEEEKDKTLLIIAEQGFGDNIQFLRYLPLVKKRVKKIIVVCKAVLLPLLRHADVDVEWLEQCNRETKFDIYAAVLSLPKIFNTHLKNVPPPLVFNDIKPKALPDANQKIKVGISWAGKPTHNNDINRSCPLDAFTKLFSIDEVQFYSWQIDVDASQRAQLKQHNVVDMSDRINNFLDSAEYLLSLDLVITVDTALAHLAATLGKPTWVLCAQYPDWRWLLDIDKSPWYPSATLFRQDNAQQWQVVLDRVRDKLVNDFIA